MTQRAEYRIWPHVPKSQQQRLIDVLSQMALRRLDRPTTEGIAYDDSINELVYDVQDSGPSFGVRPAFKPRWRSKPAKQKSSAGKMSATRTVIIS